VGPDSFSYYGWDDFTESLVSQTVELAVGGDGVSCMCACKPSSELVVMVDVDLGVAEVEGPPPRVAPPARAVAPPPGPPRPHPPTQFTFGNALGVVADSILGDLSGIANGLLSPVQSLRALGARSAEIYTAQTGQVFAGTPSQVLSVAGNAVLQATGVFSIAEGGVGADGANGRLLTGTERVRRGAFGTATFIMTVGVGVARVPVGSVQSATSSLGRVLNTDVNVAFRNVANRVFGRSGRPIGNGAANVARNAAPRGGTYLLRDPATGQVARTGRTNNFARRAAEHGRNPALGHLDFEEVHVTAVYAEQRGLEQILHLQHNPPLNRINPISLTNPYIGDYLRAAVRFLIRQNGGG
jgi:hypothetical protein